MNGQNLQGNEKRAFWRSNCRNRLSEHIWETLSINIRPEEVRLKTEDDMEYTWQIDDPSLESIFQKSLSKHSVRVYMLLYRAIGHQFRAVRPKKELNKKKELDIISKLQAEVLDLTERLKNAEDEACEYKNAVRGAEKQIMDQRLVIREAQMTAGHHQQDVQNWMALSEWYRAKCVECSDSLSHIVAFLQQTPSEMHQLIPAQN